MNARNIIKNVRIAEANDFPDPAQLGGGGPPMPRRNPRRGGGGSDTTQVLKDTLLLILVRENTFDGPIAEKLVAGQPLDPGEVQHILDEARGLENLPPGHREALQKMAPPPDAD